MEEKIVNDNELENKKIWYETYDPDFIDLSIKSRVRQDWLSYESVVDGKYGKLPVRPINSYIENIGYEPTLVRIQDNVVTIRHHLYADIYLDVNSNNEFYNVDRTWIRQYYQTKDLMPEIDGTFNEAYKFLIPWFINYSSNVSYTSVPGSPFVVKEKTEYWQSPPPNSRVAIPHFVTFKFKNHGQHFNDDRLGVARRGDPFVDMHMTINDIIVLDSIREQYASN